MPLPIKWEKHSKLFVSTKLRAAFLFFQLEDNCFTVLCGFCHTSTGISHRYTYALSLLNLHLTSHHIPSLGCHWAPGLSSPHHVINSHWRSMLYMLRYTFQCYSFNLPLPLLPHSAHKSVLCICEDLKVLNHFLGVHVEVLCKNQFLEGWQCWLASCQQSGRSAWRKASAGWLDLRVDSSGLLVLFPWLLRAGQGEDEAQGWPPCRWGASVLNWQVLCGPGETRVLLSRAPRVSSWQGHLCEWVWVLHPLNRQTFKNVCKSKF